MAEEPIGLAGFRQLVTKYASVAGAGQVTVKANPRMRDWARGVRRRGSAYVLVSPRLLEADEPVLSWFAAHEVARLMLKHPRGSADRVVIQGGLFVALAAAPVLAVAAGTQASPTTGLILAIASAAAVVVFLASLWVARRQRRLEHDVDAYAVLQLHAKFSPVHSWSIMQGDYPLMFPATRPTSSWTERMVWLLSHPETAAAIRSE